MRCLRKQHEKDKWVQEALTQSAKKMVSLLTLGFWISIQNGGNISQRAKLAVSLASSGRLIFVDRTGLRVAEYRNKELVSLVVKGGVDIIHQGVILVMHWEVLLGGYPKIIKIRSIKWSKI